MKAAVEAVTERDDIVVILTGKQEVIESELSKFQNYPKERIQVVNATEVIETAEPPVVAIRKKKDSSIVVGLNLVKKQEADAFVSSGSSGAILVGGQVIVGKKQGRAASAFGTADSHRERRFSSDRLRRQCRCKTRPSGAVCQDGIYLHGRRCGNQESPGSHCK